MLIQNYNDEISKYLKKKDSDASKSMYKARHKHEYVDCIFMIYEKAHRGKYCKICGKIRNILFFETEKINEWGATLMSSERILAKYSDLEKIPLDDFKQKYIPERKEVNASENFKTSLRPSSVSMIDGHIEE